MEHKPAILNSVKLKDTLTPKCSNFLKHLRTYCFKTILPNLTLLLLLLVPASISHSRNCTVDTFKIRTKNILPPPSAEKIKQQILAYEAFTIAKKNPARAIKIYLDLLKKNPDNYNLVKRAAFISSINNEQAEQAEKLLLKFFDDKKHQECYECRKDLYEFYIYSNGYEDFKQKAETEAKKIFYDFSSKKNFQSQATEFYVMHFLRTNNLPSAKQLIANLANQTNNDIDYWLNLSKVAKKVLPPQSRIIEKIYARLENFKNNTAEVIESIADFHAENNRKEKSIKLYREIANRSNSPLMVLFKIYKAQTALGKAKSALKTLETIVKINPYDFNTNYLLATIYAEMGKHQEAKNAFIKSFDLAIADEAFYQNAIEYLAKKNYHAPALDVAQRFYKFYNYNLIALYQVGIRNYIQHNYQNAFTYLNKFYQNVSSKKNNLTKIIDKNFYTALAQSAYEIGKYNQAERHIVKNIQLLKKSNENSEAISAERASLLNWLAYLWLQIDKNIDQAGELLKTANYLSPNRFDIIDSLGWFYYKKENFAKALELFNQSEQLFSKENPNSSNNTENIPGEILAHLAMAHSKLGNIEQAKNYIERSILNDNNDPRFHVIKAMIYAGEDIDKDVMLHKTSEPLASSQSSLDKNIFSEL